MDRREFEEARERDLDRAVEDHYAEQDDDRCLSCIELDIECLHEEIDNDI